MKLFGLEGSGFLISVCLTLFLAGMIMFYVRQALADQSAKMQSIMSIVQQMNANNMQIPMQGGNVMFHNPNVNLEMENVNKLDTINEETKSDLLSNEPGYEEEDQKIDVSEDEDDEDDDEDDEDDDEDDEEDDQEDEDDDEVKEEIVELNNNIGEVLDLNETNNTESIKEISLDDTTMIIEENLPSNNTEITLNNNLLNMSDDDEVDSDDDSDDDTIDKETSDTNNLTIADDENLDNMLMNMINAHTNSNLEEKQKELSKDIHIVELNDNKESKDSTNNLQNLKVTELRQLVKDKNIKVSNISKLKKNECIELLS